MDFDKLGPYKIGPRLGKGGMGSVYRGENIETGEAAAIKALAPQLATSEGFRERFEAEIESLKILSHDGIVRLYGYGEEASTLFYAMELVPGRSLEEELKAGRRFSWREVVDIAIQVCRALKHAHDHGIIHRDIKPANILLDENERVKLADFGIARLFGGSQLTMAGGVLGTADYMSPEQADGRPVNDRCDQYSLGCVMYALLAGRPPFRAKSLPEMLQLQRFAEPDPVRRYAPQAPEQLEDCIEQLLKKEPEDRFPNTMVLARHLEAMRRALSRPFDASQPMPGELDAEEPDIREQETDAEATPAELAATRPAVGKPNVDGEEPDDGPSIDLESISTKMRNADTIDSQVAVDEPTATAQLGDDAHFTKVDLHGAAARTVVSPSLWIATLGLVALAALVAGVIYNLMQPYNADQLYQRITAGSSPVRVENLRSNAAAIDEFLDRFGDDPRANEMRDYQSRLVLDRLGRRYESIVRGRADATQLHAIERLYVNALYLAESNPSAAAAEMQSLIALFDGADQDQSLSEEQQQTIANCLQLARRQLELLGTAVEQLAAEQLETLAERIATAEAVRDSDPEKAKRICRAIIDLYSDKSWAEDVVARAKQLLKDW